MSFLKKTSRLLVVFAFVAICAFSFVACGDKTPQQDSSSNVVKGETTIISNPTKPIDQYSPNEQIYILAGVLQSADSYRSEIVGETVSKLPKYTQSINNIHIKNGKESYLQAKSTSLLVNMGKQAFFYGDKAVCRDATDIKDNVWSQNFSVTSLANYRASFGSEATALSNYILNDETISNASSKKLDNGDFVVSCSIDVNKGTPYYSMQMVNFGGLKKLPVFYSCEISITFGSDWFPKVLVSKDDYSISKGFLNLHCSSVLTETFSGFNQTQSIPDAQAFKDNLGDDLVNPEDLIPDVEGSELLFNTILQMDTENGILVKGDLNASFGDVNSIVPVKGWLSFDINNYPSSQLNKVFTGAVHSSILGVNIDIIYIGDNFLYVSIGDTHYKYYLESKPSDEHSSLDQFINSIIISESDRQGSLRNFNISVNQDVFNDMNNAISGAVALLPDCFGPLKDIKLNDLDINITINKKNKKESVVTDVSMSADLNVMKGVCGVVVAEKKIQLPSTDDLANYKQASFDNLLKNFAFISTMINGTSSFNWKNGIAFVLEAGLESELNPSVNFLLPFNVDAQNHDQFGLRANLHFGLGALLGLPGEIFYENGSIHLVNTIVDKNTNTTYPTKVQSINILDKLLPLIPNLIGGLQNSNVSSSVLIDYLADIALNSSVVVSNLDNGVTRFELFMPEKFTKLVSKGYNDLLTKVEGMDMGDMGAIAKALLANFKFDLDDVILRFEVVDNKTSNFSIRLKNNATSAVAKGKDISFVITAKDGQNLDKGVIDNNFNLIPAGNAAMTESASVRTEISNIVNNGLTHLGDSFGAVLDSALDNYNKLSHEAQVTVLDFAQFTKIKTEFITLRDNVNKFLEQFASVEALALKGGEDANIHKALFETLNPMFNKFDVRQKEFLGSYAINKYLDIRDKNEKAFAINAVIDEINTLTKDNFPVYKDFNNAINTCLAHYNDLLEDNKKLVSNFDKISLAQKDCRVIQLTEMSNEMIALAAKIDAVNDQTPASTMRTLKTQYEKYEKDYNKLSDEEKALVPGFAQLQTRHDKLYDTIANGFIKAYEAIGGEDKVVAGDDCFALVDNAKNWLNILSPSQRTTYADQVNAVNACVKKHRDLETKAVDEVINKIGTVEFTEACHNNLLAARDAYEKIRKPYVNFVSKRNVLMNAEVSYVTLAADGLELDKVTSADKAKVDTALTAYNEATTAYKNNPFFSNNIKKKLKAVGDELKKMSEKLA